ncbi:MAG: hypothetical protein ACQKBY_13050 [Verrucomicrobiales bacterium]
MDVSLRSALGTLCGFIIAVLWAKPLYRSDAELVLLPEPGTRGGSGASGGFTGCFGLGHQVRESPKLREFGHLLGIQEEEMKRGETKGKLMGNVLRVSLIRPNRVRVWAIDRSPEALSQKVDAWAHEKIVLYDRLQEGRRKSAIQVLDEELEKHRQVAEEKKRHLLTLLSEEDFEKYLEKQTGFSSPQIPNATAAQRKAVDEYCQARDLYQAHQVQQQLERLKVETLFRGFQSYAGAFEAEQIGFWEADWWREEWRGAMAWMLSGLLISAGWTGFVRRKG